jgi:hypothetical protein
MGSAWMTAAPVTPFCRNVSGDRYRQHVITGLGERIVIGIAGWGPP